MALTPEEQRELDELEYEQLLHEQALAQDNNAPEAATSASVSQAEPKTQDEMSNFKKGLDYALRGLDYPGGIARTAVAGLANIPYAAATGQSFVGPKDVAQAFRGKAPGVGEYLERAGVPEGGSVDVPIVGDVSTRDVAGLAGDIVTDPLTALSRAGKLGANVLDVGAQSAGKKMFKSGLKKVDQAVAEKGAKPFSDVMLENKISGTSQQIQKQSESLLRDTKSARDILHEAADNAGAMVDPKVAFKDSLDKAVKMGERDPGLKDLAEKLKDKIQVYMDHGPVPLSQASEWKTNLYNALPDSAYDKFGKLKGPADRVQKSMASGLKTSIEDAGNKAAPGMGDQIAQANETMQTLLSGRKPLKQAVRSAKNINPVTSVDVMLGGATAAATHNPYQTAAMMAVKKAGDISKTTGFRTTAGKGLIRAGETGLLTPAVNRLVLQSPWTKMGDKNGR